mmetsp:Transcript_24355/g.55574  ORF Transcript_24355/g.55574 Transcript_24355/m.55574 type:complete len:1263 (-) Transcript_24355:754-4542(-)
MSGTTIENAKDGSSVSSIGSSSKKKKEEQEDKYKDVKPVSFWALFKYGSVSDKTMMTVGMSMQILVGLSMSAMNIVFGEVLDDLSTPSGSVVETLGPMIQIMFLLAAIFALTAFFAMALIPYAATRITNNVRNEYVRAVLKQDMAYFDLAGPGEVVAALSDYTVDLEEGLSTKLGEFLQGTAGVLGGLSVALYFSWQITVACLFVIPVLGFSFYMVLSSGAGSDGLLGKEAYEAAANVADETLSSMRTVAAFAGESKAASRYEENLQNAEDVAVRQGKKLGLGTGMMWGSFYLMMGVGFWWGGKLIVGSTTRAMAANPLPEGFYTAPEYSFSHALARESCRYRDIGAFGKGDLKNYTADAFEVCACKLPWQQIANTLPEESAAMVKDPNCGCTKNDALLFDSNCISGGRLMCCFFSVMIGGFLLALIGPGAQAISKARSAASKLYNVIDRAPQIDSSQNKGGTLVSKMEGRISFQNVHFKYPNGPKNIFTDLTFEICPGETVALVGESGCGKSTVARLVSRFYDPQEGRVAIDDLHLPDLELLSLRGNIGIVSQEPLLFDLTIAENISRGKKGGATRAEIIAAAKMSNAYEFVQNFPDQFDTRVGARGSKLSGGQKQRIAIARALVRNPSILILDEATSALDNESEQVVQAAIDDLTSSHDNKITTLIIAHRLSTVRNADRIIVLGEKEGMEGSTIVEQGTHDELMAKDKGLYKALVGSSGNDGAGTLKSVPNLKEAKNTATSMTVDDLIGKDLADTNDNDDDAIKSVQSTETTVDTSKEHSLSEKEKNKKIEEEFKKIDKNRLWAYSKPERPHFMAGLAACFFSGAATPLCGILFALMLSAFSISDLAYLRKATETVAIGFIIVAFVSFAATFFQIYLFEIIGEKVTRRIRIDYFRTILRQDIGWFDEPANALGVLTSRLAVDIKLIRLTLGQSTGASIQSTTSLLVGLVAALWGAWQFALAFLAVVPLLAITEAINWMLMQGGDSDAKKRLSMISGEFGQYVQGIREVQSFSLESFVAGNIALLLDDKIVANGKKAAIFRGISAGAVQLIQLGVYGLAFFIGGKMLDNGTLDYETFNVVLWGMAFGASGMGQAANWVASAAKGKAAAARVFELFSRVPPIDSKPWNVDGTARLAHDADTVRGEIEFRDVKFAYPTRKTARVFDGLSLKIPAGQTAALIGSSGSGKSTVMALLERFYDPMAAIVDRGILGEDTVEVLVEGPDAIANAAAANGSIFLDGVDIRKIDVLHLRQNIALVEYVFS